MNAYKTREQLLDKVDWEGGPAEFILGHGIDPADLPEGTPDEVTAAVTRLTTQGEADLKTFTNWLYTAPEEDEDEDPA